MDRTQIELIEKGAQNPVLFQQRDGSIVEGHIVYYPAQNPIDYDKAEVYINNFGYEQWLIKYIFER